MSGRAAAGRPSRRTRKIWLSLGGTAAALAALTALGWIVARYRETDFGDAAGSITRSDQEAVPQDAPALRFRDVAAERRLGVAAPAAPRLRWLPEDTGPGLAWSDYDADGDFDLLVVEPARPGAAAPELHGGQRLFRNDGERFVDVTAPSGLGDLGPPARAGLGMGARFADYDGDGAPDLYLTRFGPNLLLRNRGDGTFEDRTRLTGTGDPRWSISAAWGDFDRDGRLDLYVANYVAFDLRGSAGTPAEDPAWEGVPYTLNPNAFDPQPNSLYHQLPGGRFEEIALELGVADEAGRSMAATLVDLDGDGWLDLFVANDVSPDALFLNRTGELGAPIFEDASAATGTADARGSMGVALADLEVPEAAPDGLPDLFITHWVAQENGLYQAIVSPPGRLEYRDRARSWGLGEISLDRVGWGASFADFDRDGRLDLAVANGSTLERADAGGSGPVDLIAQPMFLFWNAGRRFVDLAPRGGDDLARPWNARGLASCDFDGDGDVDLAVAIHRGAPLLLANETVGPGRGLGVRLRGAPASVLGARLELASDGRRQVRWWGAEASFASQPAEEIVFGLGARSLRHELALRWSDGRSLTVRGLAAGSVAVLSAPLAEAGDVPPSRATLEQRGAREVLVDDGVDADDADLLAQEGHAVLRAAGAAAGDADDLERLADDGTLGTADAEVDHGGGRLEDAARHEEGVADAGSVGGRRGGVDGGEGEAQENQGRL